jgi:hypothetical protein
VTACTERRVRTVDDGRDREGQKGTTKGNSVVTACTERRVRTVDDGRDREGQKGTTKGALP